MVNKKPVHLNRLLHVPHMPGRNWHARPLYLFDRPKLL